MSPLLQAPGHVVSMQEQKKPWGQRPGHVIQGHLPIWKLDIYRLRSSSVHPPVRLFVSLCQWCANPGFNVGAEGVSVLFFSALIFCFDLLRVTYMALYQNQMRNLGQKKIIQGTPQQLDYFIHFVMGFINNMSLDNRMQPSQICCTSQIEKVPATFPSLILQLL